MKRFILILILGLLLRVAVIPIARHGDINNNTTWGRLVNERGPQGFYEGTDWPHSAPNQPPLYIYTFAATDFVYRTLGTTFTYLNHNVPAFPSPLIWWWEIWGELYIAKIPGILCDLLIAWCIYTYFKKEKKKALLLSALWLFTPVSLYNSAVWGGTDSVVNLLGLASVLFLLKKKFSLSAIFILASVLFKSSLALIVPVVILYMLFHARFKDFVKAAVVSVIFFYIVVLPFHFNLDAPLWMANLFVERFLPGEIGFLTANSFNLWWIIDPGKTLDSVPFFGVSARTLGILLFGVFYLYFLKKIRKQNKNLFLLLSIIPLASFLFMTRMHERYMYPFFPFATIAIGTTTWLIGPFIILSITHLLNLYHLFWAPGNEMLEAWYLNPMFPVAISIINLLVFLYITLRARRSI